MTVRGTLPTFYLVPIQHETNVPARTAQINHRITRLEQGHKNLPSSQKWPTEKSITKHQYTTAAAIPAIIVQPPTPKLSSRWSYTSAAPTPSRPSPTTLRRLLLPSSSPRADFPIPIRKGGRRGKVMPDAFLYFQYLPYEIRLEIWELAAQRPRIVEAQFSSQFWAPTFVGACTRGSPLLYTCRESREVALWLDYQFLMPAQRDFGKKWSNTPFVSQPEVIEKPVPFVPATDTIFFRSLDRPASGLPSLATSVAGFETIQHLALPLPAHGLSLRNEWKMCLAQCRDLRTLTFLVGGRDQPWSGEEEIELREVGEWFVDGRERLVRVERWLLDVEEVSAFLGGKCFEERMGGLLGDDWKGVNVRVVAWRKGDGEGL